MLEARNLHVFLGQVPVLRGVSLKVGQAETVCLVGRNGAGKTSTLKSIIGLVPLRSGAVVLDGADITHLPAHERAKLGIGFSPEDCRIFPDLTAEENLKMAMWTADASRRVGSDARGNAPERIFDVFPELRRLMQRRGLYLSGGEKKMLAIARALALDPTMLLLDEAFEGLAPIVVNRFAEALAKIKKMGVSLLVAESNLMTASRVAERLYAIDRGEIIYEGDCQGVFRNEDVMKTLRGY